MTIELLDEARKNFNNKLGNEEHGSLLPQMLDMIDTMYPGIPLYNFPLSKEECPDLSEYNVHYSRDEFAKFMRNHEQRQTLEAEVVNNQIVR